MVIEIASNDGYMLKNFIEKDIPVLGIDPAPGPAKKAILAGVPTLCNIFDFKFTLLSHNTIRGAAGGAILGAELMKAKGYLD